MKPWLTIDKLVYLDPMLIAVIYEQQANFSPATSISRREHSGTRVGPSFFNLEASTEEVREYKMSPTQMFFAVWNHLSEFPKSQVPDALKRSDPFWTNGWLCGEHHSLKEGNVVLKQYHHFSIANFDDDSSPHLHLATHDSFFSSGYDEVAMNKDILWDYMWEPVEALLRPLFANPYRESYLFAPFVILRAPSANLPVRADS